MAGLDFFDTGQGLLFWILSLWYCSLDRALAAEGTNSNTTSKGICRTCHLMIDGLQFQRYTHSLRAVDFSNGVRKCGHQYCQYPHHLLVFQILDNFIFRFKLRRCCAVAAGSCSHGGGLNAFSLSCKPSGFIRWSFELLEKVQCHVAILANFISIANCFSSAD